MTDTAATVGSISLRMLSNIFLGSVMLAPEMNIATTSSSNDVMKARNAAEYTLGASTGSVIVRTAASRPAPRPRAASSRLGSKSRRPASSTITTKGSASTVWATATPYHSPIRPNRENRP